MNSVGNPVMDSNRQTHLKQASMSSHPSQSFQVSSKNGLLTSMSLFFQFPFDFARVFDFSLQGIDLHNENQILFDARRTSRVCLTCTFQDNVC